MKLRVGSKGTIIILMLTLISFHFLYLFELPINDNSVRYLTWIAAILRIVTFFQQSIIQEELVNITRLYKSIIIWAW